MRGNNNVLNFKTKYIKTGKNPKKRGEKIMKLRKMLAIGLTTMSVVGLTALTATAAGEKVASYDFEGDNSAWYNGGEGNGTTITNVIHQDVTENGNTFRRLGFDAVSVAKSAQISSTLELPASTIVFDEPVEFVNGQIIKVSSKIRSNQFNSQFRILPGIAMNVPYKAYNNDATKAETTKKPYSWNRYFRSLYAVIYENSTICTQVFQHVASSTSNGFELEENIVWGSGGIPTRTQASTSKLSANVWYEVDTYLTIGEENKITKIRTVVNDGKMGDTETDVNVQLSSETSLKSLHLYTGIRNELSEGKTVENITVDFDDIEVTVFENAEELGNEPCYVNDNFKFGLGTWSRASNWGTDQADNPMKTTITTEDGVVKIYGTDTGNGGQYDLVGLHKALAKAITPSTDKDFVVKTRIRNTCDTATVHFMINRKTAWTEGHDQGRLSTNTFFKISNNAVSFRAGTSSNVAGWINHDPAYKGETLNKWFDVEFYFDSSDKTLYGSVKDEAGNVYSLVHQTDWTIADIESFSVMLVDVDSDTYDENGKPTIDETKIVSTEYRPVSCEVASFEFYEVPNAEWVTLTDEDGNEVTEIKAGDKVCAKYNFKPAYEDIIKYYAMTALYSKDENGALKLEKVEVKDLGSNMGYYNGTTEAITIPEEGEYVVKAFIWNSASLKPMMANDEV